MGQQHLRERYDKPGLVNEFIEEFEGDGIERDIIRWSQFTDQRQNDTEMLERLDACFEKWLNPN